MRWLFGNNSEQEKTTLAIQQLTLELQKNQEQIAQISSGLNERATREKELHEQLNKLTRVQYKAGQETQLKWEQLLRGLDSIQKWQDEFAGQTQNNGLLARQNEQLLNVLVLHLDEIDLALANLRSGGEDWANLLRQWADRMVNALSEAGVYEIDVLGKPFNPHLAEGVGVVERVRADSADDSAAGISYEVAEVTKRGFADAAGRVLRKAQVITYKESAEIEEENR